nr:MAG TPA: hypothetical protein [Caudoviricetes sp.]
MVIMSVILYLVIIKFFAPAFSLMWESAGTMTCNQKESEKYLTTLLLYIIPVLISNGIPLV